MALDIPPHDFTANDNATAGLLIVTPELQRWADQAIMMLDAARASVPADLVLLRDGCAVSRFRWLWLVDEVLTPRPTCPF